MSLERAPESIQLLPLVGFLGVRFGMSRDEVVAQLGQPECENRTWDERAIVLHWGSQCSLSLHFSPELEYIEFSDCCDWQVELFGCHVFETPAAVVIKHMLGLGHAFDPNEREPGYTFVFKDIQASFWRPVLPEESEHSEGDHFSTVGIGRAGYYER